MKYAYLTCELIGRDLDSRLLIAAHLVKRGISCVVGQQWSMFANAPTCPSGVFLLKTANKFQSQFAIALRSAGQKVAISDEEVLASCDEVHIRQCTDIDALKNADKFLALNEWHKNIVTSIYPVEAEVVGNPRADLLLSHANVYRAEADRLQSKGRYILFNTSFGWTNGLWGERAYSVICAGTGMDPEAEETREWVESLMRFEIENRNATLKVIEWASKNLNHRLVVRPHPNENPDSWRAVEGIEVAAKTSPIPWLLGADLMIHSCSTTGLEGALLGTPCLNLNPSNETRFINSYVVNDLNFTVRSADQAVVAIEQYINRHDGPLAQQPVPNFLVGGAQRTAEAIASLAPSPDTQLTTWGALPRGRTAVEKFSIEIQEFAHRAQAICGSAGVKLSKILQIDQSTFLVE